MRGASIALAALAAMGSLGFVNVPSAAAWSYYQPSGRTGAVTVPQMRVMETYINWAPVLTFDTVTGPLVQRAAGTVGPQSITAFETLQRWDGYAWATIRTNSFSANLASTHTAATFPALRVMPSSLTSTGYFRATWVFVWSVNGQVIGSTGVTSDRGSDHVCITTKRPCLASPGFVRIGRLFQLGGGW